MSRVGKRVIDIPGGVKVELKGRTVHVQGPKGKLDFTHHPRLKVSVSDKTVQVARPTDIQNDRALHGMTRALIQNMVHGVVSGYSKELEIEGVGFKAQLKGKVLQLNLGFTHPIEYQIPDGIEIKCISPIKLLISGIDKHMVGQVSAEIRGFHEPEPYKGKGIHYVGEQFRRKQGKTVG